MAGLNFGTYGGVKVGASSSNTAPSTVTEAAFGPGYTSASPDGLGAALTPNDAFGHAFWLGIVAIGLLVFIRQSLPR